MCSYDWDSGLITIKECRIPMLTLASYQCKEWDSPGPRRVAAPPGCSGLSQTASAQHTGHIGQARLSAWEAFLHTESQNTLLYPHCLFLSVSLHSSECQPWQFLTTQRNLSSIPQDTYSIVNLPHKSSFPINQLCTITSISSLASPPVIEQAMQNKGLCKKFQVDN